MYDSTAFQERNSRFDYISAGAVRLPSAREQRRADSAAVVAVPRLSIFSPCENSLGGDSVETWVRQTVYIVPRTGRLTTRERTILENTTVRWPEQTRHCSSPES